VVTITAISADDSTKSATTTVTVVAAPSVPVITAPAFVGPGQGGYVASVPAQATGTSYLWSINNGSITGGNGTRSITYFTGATGTVDLSCVATNAAGLPSVAGTFSSTVSTAPLATALLPVTNPVPFGGSTMINPLFSGGTGAVDQSVGTVTNNTPFSSGVITAPKTFTLTVTNGLLQTATTTVTLNPTPVSVSAISPANQTRTVNTGTVFSATATGGVTNTLSWTATAGAINSATGAWTAPPSPAAVTITATSVDDPTKFATTTVTVVAAPVASGLVASTTTPAFGATFTLTPNYSGGVPTIDQGVTCPASGTASSPITANWAGAKVYTLTVTNQAGVAVSATTTVTPKMVNLTAITPATPTRTVNSTTTFSAMATNGATNSINWTASAGTMGASTGVWIAPPSAQTVTITATSVDDPSKSVTTTVTLVPAPATPIISAPAYVDPIQSGLTASVPSQATGLIYTWAISNGSITAGNGTRSITFSTGTSGTVGLSCTISNAAGDAAPAATASCTIVAIPSISLISASPTIVAPGGASTLSYTFAGGPGVLTPGNIPVTSGGTNVVNPAVTTTYTLTITSQSGTTTTDTVTVTVINKPTIATFKAGPDTITAGQGTLLSFNFTDDGSIDQNVGAVSSGGQVAVFPTVTTTYTLTANNAFSGTTTQTVTVTVKQFDGKFVYVANTGGGVSGFKLDDGTGLLSELDNSPFDSGTAEGGTTPTPALHVTCDAQGKFLFVVNGDGQTNLANTLTSFKIDQATGDLTKVAAYATGNNPWASVVDPTGQFVYVRCAGSISAFSLDGSSGVLTPLATPSIPTAAGTGDVLIHPSGQYLFTVGRASDQLQVFNLDATTGALSPNGTYGLPAGTGPLSLALSYSGDYLFTKSEGTPSGPATDCTIYAFYLDLQTGGLTPLANTATGMLQADAFHGVSANPTQPVIYITLATSDNDFAAYALNLNTGALSPLDASTYDLFGGTGSDSLVVSRNGKWGFMTNFSQHQIAVGAVNPSTGILTNPTFVPVGISPVSVCVAGSVQ
jgi:6-phosphogluconolactonase (cycloisomerase 2 family)